MDTAPGLPMDYEKAANYWTDRAVAPNARPMERAELLVEIERFIAAHNTCALATAGADGFVRCTPLEYTWWRGAFWLLSEGGLKFRALATNDNVCLAIYDAYQGFGALGGMQVTGTAAIVEPWSPDYLALLDHKDLPVDRLRTLPSPMHLIKVTPIAIDFLSSSLKEQGVDSRQHLELGEAAS